MATVHAHEYGNKEGKSPLYHIGAILEKYGINREEYSELALWCKKGGHNDSANVLADIQLRKND